MTWFLHARLKVQARQAIQHPKAYQMTPPERTLQFQQNKNSTHIRDNPEGNAGRVKPWNNLKCRCQQGLFNLAFWGETPPRYSVWLLLKVLGYL
eukprot:4468984-Amphidinium_carterae.1